MKFQLIHIVFCFAFFSVARAESSFDRGLAEFGKENYIEAINCFNQAIEDTPRNISAYYNLGLSCMGAEDYKNALWAFEKVLKMDPSDAAAAERASFAFFELNNQEEWEPILNGPFDFVFNVSSNMWSIFAIIFSLIFAFSVVVFRKALMLSTKRIMLIISFASMAFLLISIYSAHRTQAYFADNGYALVTAESIPTYINDETANGSLNAGKRVHKISIYSEQLINVEDASGNVYLVRSEDLRFI